MAALVNFSTILKVFFSRRARIEAPDPLSLVIQPTVDLKVTRYPNDDLHLTWTFPAEQVEVFASATPDAMGTLQGTVTSAKEFTVTGLDRPVRYYFTLKITHAGQTSERKVAERILPLENGSNFRDIGGYPTAEGNHTRWGRIFRTGSFSGFSEFDKQYLTQLGLKLVCDLRTDSEVEHSPDELPEPNVTYWRQALFTQRESQDGVRRFLLSVNDVQKINNALLQSYTLDMLDRKGAMFGAILQRCADESQLPMAIHCTAGKDRTGVTIALLFAALGVPDDIIVADYSLTNFYHGVIRSALKRNSRGLRILRLTQDDLMPLLLAHPDTMRGTLVHLRESYGSYENYLAQQAGIDAETIARLRNLLLE
ncbi:MAG: tyrosine-protein phosphatase [Anaerolineae bacterium]|nr:tyrosine-protein phosphatase [Anaerolineae bacterium]